MNTSHGVRIVFARLLASLVVASVPAAAVAQTWSGATDNNWSTATNWVGGVVPANNFTTSVVFSTPATSHTPFADVPWLLNRLDVLGAVPYALGGGPLSFDGAAPAINVAGAGHTIANTIQVFSTLDITHTADLLISGSLSASGSVTKFGASRLALTGTTLPGGTLTIAGGTLQLGDGATGPGNSGPIVNNGALETNVPGGLLINGNHSGSGSLTVTGGMLASILGNSFTHAGTTTIATTGGFGGQIVNNARLTVDGTLDTAGSTVGSLTGTGMLGINGGVLVVGGDGTDSTFQGFFLGGGGIEKVGPGHLTLAVNGLPGGTLTITSGTLTIGNGGALSSVQDIVNNSVLIANTSGVTVNGSFTGTGSLTVQSGTVGQLATPFAYTGATTINAGGNLDATLTNGGPLTIAAGGTMNTAMSTVASLTGAGNLFVNGGLFTVGTGNADTVFTGNITNNGSIDKVGTGRLTLTGLSLPSGTTTVSAGTLQLGDGVNAPSGSLGPLVVNAALEVNVPTGFAVFSTLSGSGTVTVLGGLLAQLGPAFTHTGATTVNAGGAIGASIINNARLTLDGVMDTGGSTVGSLAGVGQLNLNSGTFTVGGDNTSTVFSGPITNIGSVVKNGTGRLTLSGVSTYTGGTTINAGTLAVTGTMLGPVTVNAGGTLGGTGTVNGSVTVNAGATLSPGLTPGLLNTGNLVLAGVLLEEIEGTILGAQYDSVNVTGTVDLAGATLTLAGAFVPGAGNTFTLITNDGVDAVVGTFAGLAEGATVTLNGVTLRISYIGGTGNDVTLIVLAAPPGVSAVPVPAQSGWSLAILAALLLLAGGITMRRRERR